MKMHTKDYKNLDVDSALAMNIYEVTNSRGVFDWCYLDIRIPYEHPERGYRLGIYTFGRFSSVENANKFILRMMEARDSENGPEFFDAEAENALIEEGV